MSLVNIILIYDIWSIHSCSWVKSPSCKSWVKSRTSRSSTFAKICGQNHHVSWSTKSMLIYQKFYLSILIHLDPCGSISCSPVCFMFASPYFGAFLGRSQALHPFGTDPDSAGLGSCDRSRSWSTEASPDQRAISSVFLRWMGKILYLLLLLIIIIYIYWTILWRDVEDTWEKPSWKKYVFDGFSFC